MMSADAAREATKQARDRFVKRDDVFTVESMIGERAASGWWSLSLMPFSPDKDRAAYVALMLQKAGYSAVVVPVGGAFGLDIDWHLKEDAP